jgi:predicted phosphodiesterase
MASISDHAYQYIAARAHPADAHDRLVVFGHTHTPELKRLESPGRPGHVVYANPGSWVDRRFLSGRLNCTFVEIYNGTGVLEGYKQVSLKQFHAEEDITDLTDPVWMS